MALRISANEAEDAAARLRIFRAPVPEQTAEISNMIAELFAISSLFNRLDDLVNDYQPNLVLIRTDLDLVQASLKYTLDDLMDFFGEAENAEQPRMSKFVVVVLESIWC